MPGFPRLTSTPPPSPPTRSQTAEPPMRTWVKTMAEVDVSRGPMPGSGPPTASAAARAGQSPQRLPQAGVEHPGRPSPNRRSQSRIVRSFHRRRGRPSRPGPARPWSGGIQVADGPVWGVGGGAVFVVPYRSESWVRIRSASQAVGSTLLFAAIACSPSTLTRTHEGPRGGGSRVRRRACHPVELLHHCHERSSSASVQASCATAGSTSPRPPTAWPPTT